MPNGTFSNLRTRGAATPPPPSACQWLALVDAVCFTFYPHLPPVVIYHFCLLSSDSFLSCPHQLGLSESGEREGWRKGGRQAGWGGGGGVGGRGVNTLSLPSQAERSTGSQAGRKTRLSPVKHHCLCDVT